MEVDPIWWRFPTCPDMSRFVPVCPLLSFLGQIIGIEFGEGDATKQKSVKKSPPSLNECKAFSEVRWMEPLVRNSTR